jgi:hypothetical protein
MAMVKKVLKVAHHRNGIGGAPFYVVSFKSTDKQNMVGILFEGDAECAVLDVDMLKDGVIEFGQNSWRGDNYEPELRQAVEAYEKTR